MMIQEFKSSKNRAQLMSGLANLTKKQSELSAKQYQHHLCLKKKRIGSFFDIFDKRGSLKKYLKFKQVGWAGESLLRWVFVTKTTNQRYFKKKQLWNCQSLLFLPKLPISLISKTCSKKLQKTGDITRFLFCIRHSESVSCNVGECRSHVIFERWLTGRREPIVTFGGMKYGSKFLERRGF